ncbi:hypothetical protein VOLCADRAFT_95617 [Volvox carteri f. nagariensis]|uniref:Chlorophyllase n=1 Tax=Volvox carteri f. nagariensis TaxID=3068 RepID=D8U7S7_VOLCA|nr:uncharacterized protein VOLCADRAFT_95617 [Volvox carteri f. nagariensis]EFJ44147.1 hypothetical protein VOLCADRAFT_95617 [Volvox carteri f. nagariensis]|eukprot:XP_002954741.1 hypothetical protein VOLCADRAFT_95617 [Volvox carteri f. nagariensis]
MIRAKQRQRLQAAARALLVLVILLPLRGVATSRALAALSMPEMAGGGREFTQMGPYSVSSCGTRVDLASPSVPCKASWYADIVSHVASWGYVVLQYDGDWNASLALGERGEVAYLDPLLEWLEDKAPSVAGCADLKGAVNFTRSAVMGHSRGGKMAALLYAIEPTNLTNIVTAVLLDPVDCAGLEGSRYPSAIAKLVGLGQQNNNFISCGDTIPQHGRSNLSAAIIGAGYHVGRCNPQGSNYQSFFDAFSTNSLNILLKEAGHMQFAQSDDPNYVEFAKICGGNGNITNEVCMPTRARMSLRLAELIPVCMRARYKNLLSGFHTIVAFLIFFKAFNVREVYNIFYLCLLPFNGLAAAATKCTTIID